uniref:hypothetical protein n=1 Tax=Amplisiphonia pacifica TaxID=1563190 RepID=UPI0022FD6D75|nr:hypothetical protein PNY92_pgp116 [Amplisiphonia pacifica]WAX03272.1 hypothetical protein [Amplisiphonia pacifica]
MQNNLYTFLNRIQGNWFLQENFYLLPNKQHTQNKERVSFLKNSQNIRFDLPNFLIKNINSHKSLFKLEKAKANRMTIRSINRNGQVNYKEYIYLINNNLIISLIIIKNSHKQTYLGIKISSYIRLIQ